MGDVTSWMAEQEADAAERKVAPAPKHAPWRATVRMDGALRELTLTPSGDGKTWSYGTSGQCYARTGAEAVETFARMCNWKVLEIIPPEGETYDAARVPTPLIHELLSGVTEGDWQWFSFGGDPGVHTFRRKDMSYELLATTKHRKNATLMAAAKDLALDLIDARAEVSRLRALVAADDRVAVAKRQERERLAAYVASMRAEFGKGWTVRTAVDLIVSAIGRDPATVTP